ncbi:uncharacterized protein Dwil_GK27722 [Drosophila willistoni]|nr:uncharacterized protein Dwil_GK27722 [Drosophila willistoni]
MDKVLDIVFVSQDYKAQISESDEISVSRGDLVELISTKDSGKPRCFIRMFDSGEAPKEGWVPTEILEFSPNSHALNGKENGDAEFRKR